MRISPTLPTLRGSIVQHVRRMVLDHEINELASRPEHLLTLMAHLHSAPITLAPAMQSIHPHRSATC